MPTPPPGQFETVNLRLELSQPGQIPALRLARWSDLVQAVIEYDGPPLIFLGELLGIIDSDPQPHFTCQTYTRMDMFGGCDRNWRLKTRHASIHRQLEQSINDSWQRVEVDADVLQITGLPAGVFIDWDGYFGDPFTLTIGGISAGMARQILALTAEIFSQVKQTQTEANKSDALRAGLKRASQYGESASAIDADNTELLLMLQDSDDEIATAALDRLSTRGALDNPEILTAILELPPHNSQLVRIALVRALGKTATPQVVPPLISALKDGSSMVSEAAAEALRRIGDRRAIPALEKALGNRNAAVRKAAVIALSDILKGQADASTLAKITAMLKDEDHYTRDVTAWTLIDFRSSTLVEPLRHALKDSYFAVRHGAVQALVAQGDPRIISDLLPMLNDDNDHVRFSVVEALAALGDLQVIPHLQRLADNPHTAPQLQTAASTAINRLSHSQ